ncbi:MAG: hypothetical protein HOQ05_11400 [Corynebacteriales bacterium]|nr:hypothetical protein [Mycobacteriales bacterium]
MSASGAPEPVPAAPVRTTGRIIGGIAVILVAIFMMAVGIHALVDPGAVVAGSSNSARSPDSEAEAKFGGLLLCLAGISVLSLGIGLVTSKKKLFTKDPSS